jgi:hypothetical protein
MARRRQRDGQENRRRAPSGGSGLPVDFVGGPTVDPTENVKDLSQALSERQDDLREINNLYLLQRVIAVEEVAKIRAKHAKEINQLNNDRLEKIRQVDNLNAQRSEERAGEGIKALATQTASIAEASRTTAANTAAQIATQLTTLFAESNKRISALELSSSEGRGKQAVADPQMERLAGMVEKLATREATVSGKSEGTSDSAKVIIAALGMLLTLTALYTFTQRPPTTAAPQVIYVPAPAGALLPTTPPQPTPR